MQTVGLIEQFQNPRCQAPDINDGKYNIDKLCRQLMTAIPGAFAKDCVSDAFVPVKETPANGALIRIICAGVCLKPHNYTLSASKVSTAKSDLSTSDCNIIQSQPPSVIPGIQERLIFPGFEVAGVIEALGENVNQHNKYGITIGQRVIVYPNEQMAEDYVELCAVSDLKHLIVLPDSVPMSLAAMLPTGGLLAMSTVFKAHKIVTEILSRRQAMGNTFMKCKMLIVGTGDLALWTLRIAEYYFTSMEARDYIDITIASLRDEGLTLSEEIKNVKIVQWNEHLYEQQLVERVIDACNGTVDVIIDYGTSSRSLYRSLNCLSKDGGILITNDVAQKLLSNTYQIYGQQIVPLTMGSIQQLHELVDLVANGKIQAPPYTVFPSHRAAEVTEKLCNSQIAGHAILSFHDIKDI